MPSTAAMDAPGGRSLLDDPQVELAAMCPHLAEWWRRNADKFRDLGAGQYPR